MKYIVLFAEIKRSYCVSTPMLTPCMWGVNWFRNGLGEVIVYVPLKEESFEEAKQIAKVLHGF